MKTLKINSTQNFTHQSETVTAILNYIISYLKPNKFETLLIHEELELSDYGNEYLFLLNFLSLSEDEDLIEEIDSTLQDISNGHPIKHIDTDFVIMTKYDYTSNHHFIMITFSK